MRGAVACEVRKDKRGTHLRCSEVAVQQAQAGAQWQRQVQSAERQEAQEVRSGSIPTPRHFAGREVVRAESPILPTSPRGARGAEVSPTVQCAPSPESSEVQVCRGAGSP